MSLEHLPHAELTDEELLAEAISLAVDERRATVRLVAALAEVDARRLHLGQDCSSLFVYCTRVLKLSEHAAYGRIEAARAARRFPVLNDWLDRGDLTLTTLCLLAPHLTEANVEALLDQARGRSKRQVEEIVAALRPQPYAAPTIRKLLDRTATAVECTPRGETEAPAPTASSRAPGHWTLAEPPGPRARIQPVAPERYKLQVTIDTRTEEKLRRATPPATACPPANRSRHIPAAVRREVWRRDEGRCAFVRPTGRCGETGFLEFHHMRAYSDNGPATTENIELRCRAHNQYEAGLPFADLTVDADQPSTLGLAGA